MLTFTHVPEESRDEIIEGVHIWYLRKRDEVWAMRGERE